ncbi:hypothetical protein JCM16303_005005 [Sporobolomyces ruberrimus]
MATICDELVESSAPDVALEVSGFRQTLSEVVRDPRPQWVNAGASSKNRLRNRYKALCSLAAYYAAYQEACYDVENLPARFVGKSRTDALRDVNRIISRREGRKSAFGSRQWESLSRLDPMEAAYEERQQILAAEAELQLNFKKAIGAHNFRGPQKKDIAAYTRWLEQRRDEMKQKVATLFSKVPQYLEDPAPAVSSPIEFVNPFASASSPAHGHDQHSQSLAKSQYRPVPRRVLV